MKRVVASVLIASMTLTSLAWADGPSPPTSAQTPAPAASTSISPDDPGMIAPMGKGQPAPFPGILFSPRAAASVVTDVTTIKEKIKIESDAAVRAAEAKKDFAYNELNTVCTAERSKNAAIIEANSKRILLLEKDLQDAKDAAPNRGLWFGLGAAGGVVVTVLAAITVVQLTK